MIVSVLLAHPDPLSFNGALASAAVRVLRGHGHTVRFHDLHAERFDPVLTADEIRRDASLPEAVSAHCREIAEAEGIVIVHPNWWGQPPAALKGWVDRVLRPGVAYRFREGDDGEGVPEGLLKARTAVVLVTSDTPAEREAAVFGEPLVTLWRNCIFGLCGVRDVRLETFRVVVTSTPDQRREWLLRAERLVMRCFPGAGGRECEPGAS
jgi:NAD(P)H dehydrogenase (quinone)